MFPTPSSLGVNWSSYLTHGSFLIRNDHFWIFGWRRGGGWTTPKHREIAKRCPEYISSVVKVSSCSYLKTLLKFFHKLRFVTIWVEFCHNLSFLVLSQFDFLSGQNLSFWVFSQFDCFSFHNFFLSFFLFWVF